MSMSMSINESFMRVMTPDLDALAQPLRDAQDERLSKLGDAGAKGIHQQIRDLEDQREACFWSDPVRDSTVESRFTAKVKALRALLRPALILENPAVGSLYEFNCARKSWAAKRGLMPEEFFTWKRTRRMRSGHA
jgi:hypothetical protein